jgi:hypothetical protein
MSASARPARADGLARTLELRHGGRVERDDPRALVEVGAAPRRRPADRHTGDGVVRPIEVAKRLLREGQICRRPREWL